MRQIKRLGQNWARIHKKIETVKIKIQQSRDKRQEVTGEAVLSADQWGIETIHFEWLTLVAVVVVVVVIVVVVVAAAVVELVEDATVVAADDVSCWLVRTEMFVAEIAIKPTITSAVNTIPTNRALSTRPVINGISPTHTNSFIQRWIESGI